MFRTSLVPSSLLPLTWGFTANMTRFVSVGCFQPSIRLSTSHGARGGTTPLEMKCVALCLNLPRTCSASAAAPSPLANAKPKAAFARPQVGLGETTGGSFVFSSPGYLGNSSQSKPQLDLPLHRLAEVAEVAAEPRWNRGGTYCNTTQLSSPGPDDKSDAHRPPHPP